MVTRNFSKATSFTPKDYYFPIKEMFTIPAFSFLSNNATTFTSYKPGNIKSEYYLVVSIHWV